MGPGLAHPGLTQRLQEIVTRRDGNVVYVEPVLVVEVAFSSPL